MTNIDKVVPLLLQGLALHTSLPTFQTRKENRMRSSWIGWQGEKRILFRTGSMQVSGKTSVQMLRKAGGIGFKSRIDSFVIRLSVALSKLASYQTSRETIHPPPEKIVLTSQRRGTLAFVKTRPVMPL
jgi:hypothetical protein